MSYSRILVLAALSKGISTFGIVTPPSSHRWMLFLPIVAINAYCYFSTFTDDTMRRNAVIETLVASDYLVLTDVQREFRQVGQREPISKLGVWSRFKWAIRLLLSPRGVGWTYEPTSALPSRPNLPRHTFLRSQLILLVWAIVGNDLAFILTSIDSGFAKDARPFSEQPLVWRFWATALFFFKVRKCVEVYYFFVSFLLVGMNMSEPSSWPEFFGSWSDAYTVRRWWGKVWHQSLRRIFASHGKFLAHRVLGFRPGGTASSYTQLYVAFFLSGIIHVTSYDPRPIWYFMAQAVTITFEEIVLTVTKKAGMKSSKATRLLGYVWVYCNLVFTFGPYFDSMNAVGLGLGGYDGTIVLGRYRDSQWLTGLLSHSTES